MSPLVLGEMSVDYLHGAVSWSQGRLSIIRRHYLDALPSRDCARPDK